MTGSAGLWISLALGVWLTRLGARRVDMAVRLPTAVGMLGAFASAVGDPAFAQGVGWWQWSAALVWWLGMGGGGLSGVSSRSDQRCSTLGSSCLVVAGLLATATGKDWVTLLLAVEIVRRATNGLRESSEPDEWEATSLWCSSLALAGWVFVVGSTDLGVWRDVLLQSYSENTATSAIGRPSSLVTASVVLTVFSVVGPVLWTWRDVGGPADCRLDTTISVALARQIVAISVLHRVMGLLIPELYGTGWIVLAVLVLTTWVISVRWLTDSHRLDVVLLGMTHAHGAFMLAWLLSAIDPASAGEAQAGGVVSVDARRMVLVGLVYHAAIMAGLVNAAGCLVDLKTSPPFLDEFRGLAKLRPLPAACLIACLLSVAAMPMTAGFWMLCMWLISLLGLHQWRGDALVPHAGVQVLLVVGLAMWGFVSAAAFRMIRMLLLEIPVGHREFPGNSGKLAIAMAVAGAIWLLGMAPLLFWLGVNGSWPAAQ